MKCLYTGDDCSFCTCSSCADQRRTVSHPIRFDDLNDALRQLRQQAAEPHRRRPCPTGIPGSLDGIVPYQPSRCANGCTCCAWCRGEDGPDDRKWCTCPIGPIPESNCVRGHSGLVECRDGCKPRPIPSAVVVQRRGLIGRLFRWLRPP